MKDSNALQFSREWAAAWNARDVEAVLAQFHDDVLFVSPVAQQIGFAADGTVIGKDPLRRYWLAALARNPTLRFTVKDVFQGVDSISILFTNQDGTDRIEFLRFHDNLVIEGHALSSFQSTSTAERPDCFGVRHLPGGAPPNEERLFSNRIGGAYG